MEFDPVLIAPTFNSRFTNRVFSQFIFPTFTIGLSAISPTLLVTATVTRP